jgi:hypothetical protein
LGFLFCFCFFLGGGSFWFLLLICLRHWCQRYLWKKIAAVVGEPENTLVLKVQAPGAALEAADDDKCDDGWTTLSHIANDETMATGEDQACANIAVYQSLTDELHVTCNGFAADRTFPIPCIIALKLGSVSFIVLIRPAGALALNQRI